jgi:hypothetical protein
MADYIDISHGDQLHAKTLFSSMPHFASVRLIWSHFRAKGNL